MNKKYISAYKSGRAFNGAHRDAGRIIHYVPQSSNDQSGYWGGKSLCRTQTGIRGNGWYESDKAVNCEKCINKFNKLNIHIMETTKVFFSNPMYPSIKCDPNSEWGVYYNIDAQSEDFETGDSLPGLKTNVIAEKIDKRSADIIAQSLNIHNETGLTPRELLRRVNLLENKLSIVINLASDTQSNAFRGKLLEEERKRTLVDIRNTCEDALKKSINPKGS